jgi:tripartite-type tricarboxylate transporter receptor subunit TctC
VQAKTPQELVSWSKANAGKVNLASPGATTLTRLSGELFKQVAGLDWVTVHYKGGAPAVQDMLSGNAHVMFANISDVIAHVKAGKLTGLAVSGTKRSSVAPDVPTAAEGGLVGYDATFAEVLYVRRGTPKAVIDALNDAITRAIAQPDVRQRLLAADLEPLANTAAAAAERLRHDIEKWRTVLHTMNLKLD